MIAGSQKQRKVAVGDAFVRTFKHVASVTALDRDEVSVRSEMIEGESVTELVHRDEVIAGGEGLIASDLVTDSEDTSVRGSVTGDGLQLCERLPPEGRYEDEWRRTTSWYRTRAAALMP